MRVSTSYSYAGPERPWAVVADEALASLCVGEAVQRCRDAGVSVVMVNGDHAATACNIAGQIGMSGDEGEAPALKKSDIGFAMGIRGTAVAREAAAMVLRDDVLPALALGASAAAHVKALMGLS